MKIISLLGFLSVLFVGCASPVRPVSTVASPEKILGSPFKMAMSGLSTVKDAYGKSAMILEPRDLIGWGITLNLSERLFDNTPVDFEVRFDSRTHHLWIRVFPETEGSTPFPVPSDDNWLVLIKNHGRTFIHRELPDVDIFSVVPGSAQDSESGGDSVGLVLVLSKGELILNRLMQYDVDYRVSPVKSAMDSLISVTLRSVDTTNQRQTKIH
ncbi:MAG: hypothetical protein WCT25_01470 [Candidatus Paceibacterota bacterium]|jgi:hypothetical protein